jgi:hypothetical protein
MSELELYKFIKDNNVEIDWRGEKLIIWIHHMDIKDFCELLGSEFFDDGGYDVNLRFGYSCCIALDLVPICDYFDIEPTNIFKKED